MIGAIIDAINAVACDRVVTGAAGDFVVAALAEEKVVAVLAVEFVRTVAASHLFIAFAAVWLWLCVRLLQWRDLHADRARARQDPMGPATWVKTNPDTTNVMPKALSS